MTGFALGRVPAPGERAASSRSNGNGRRLEARGAAVHVAEVLHGAPVRDGAGVQRRGDDLREPRADEPRAREERRTRDVQAILKLEGPYNPGLTVHDIPVDAVTTSGSGIDPDISQAYAALQAHRVAAVRHLPLATVHELIARTPTAARGASWASRASTSSSSTSRSTSWEASNGASERKRVLAGARRRGDPRLVPEARSTAAAEEPCHVHRRARQPDHDGDLLPGDRARALRAACGSSASSRSGSG